MPPQIQQKMRIKAKKPWKKVKVEDHFLNQEVPEDFLGIEELTDYKLVKKTKKAVVVTKAVKKSKAKKKKAAGKIVEKNGIKNKRKNDDSESEDAEVSSEEPASKRVKVKKHDVESDKEIDETKETASNRVMVKEQDVESDKEIDKTNEEVDDSFEVTPDMMIWKAMYLPDSMVRAVWELGFENPTAIQLAVLPTAMKGRKDIVGAAETGSGKTLAFGIPILAGILKDKEFDQKKAAKNEDEESGDSNDDDDNNEQVEEEENEESVTEEELDDEENIPGLGCVKVIDHIPSVEMMQKVARSPNKLRALIITPTRELAVQIHQHLKAVAKYTGITMCLVIGGMAAPKQERLLNKGPDIVIGTPGRLWELMSDGNPHLSQAQDIRYLALDETDRLLEQGHFTELRTILEHINKNEAKKKWRQNFVFSATLTLIHDPPRRLKSKKKKQKQSVKLENLLSLVGVRPKAKVVDLTSSAKQLKPASLSEMKILSASLEDKDYYLYYFLRHETGRTLVFCNSISNVRRLTSVFTLLQMKPLPLHAQMQQKQRLKNLERFSRNENALMIATDVAARGLDIPHVQHVVHFQVPRTSENYVHRSGRTARAFRDGLSLMLIEPGETSLYRQLCTTLNKQKADLPDYDIDMKTLTAVKQRVNLAKEIESMEHRMKRTRSEESWIKKMADEAELVIDDDLLDEDDAGVARFEQAQLVNQLKGKRKELERLILRPLKRTQPSSLVSMK